MTKPHMFILYVNDQERSRIFYEAVLEKAPVLHVPGMTEFKIAEGVVLGLMPENGIAKIVSPVMPHPAEANGTPRCELYLIVGNPDECLQRAINSGAALVSPAQARDWGDTVAYCADPDGHIIAFAK
jgi:uncharacterized glyoxalase superfamily protein PhnB